MPNRKLSPDFFVQLGIFILTAIAGIVGTVAFCFTTFATKSEIAIERDERRELKAEIDTMYKLLVPEPERKPLAHPHLVGEKE